MLNGKRALVTGAQQGIGAGTALALAEAGADVAVHYLDDRDAAAALAARIEGMGRRAVLCQAELSTAAASLDLVAQAEAALGGLDVLVNNAAIFPASVPLEVTEEEWDRVMAVNLKSGFFCAQAAARGMIARGAGGAIVNVSSIGAEVAWHTGPHYAASKGGLVSLTRQLALSFAKDGIRVNCVAPGLVDTPQPRGHMSQADFDAIEQTMPMHRVGEPADIADPIVFLASDASRYMTGQTLHVNGGIYMR